MHATDKSVGASAVKRFVDAAMHSCKTPIACKSTYTAAKYAAANEQRNHAIPTDSCEYGAAIEQRAPECPTRSLGIRPDDVLTRCKQFQLRLDARIVDAGIRQCSWQRQRHSRRRIRRVVVDYDGMMMLVLLLMMMTMTMKVTMVLIMHFKCDVPNDLGKESFFVGPR